MASSYQPQVPNKLACAVTEAGLKLEIIYVRRRRIVLSFKDAVNKDADQLCSNCTAVTVQLICKGRLLVF